MSVELPEHLFTAIDHVGIAVADLDAAMAFYHATFGMQTVHEEVNEEQGVREAMVAVGESGSCIQLLAPLDGSSAIATFLDRNGPGIQQLAYRVTDLEAVSAVLRGRGVRLLYDVARHGRVAGELRASQGRRRRSGGARRAGVTGLTPDARPPAGSD